MRAGLVPVGTMADSDRTGWEACVLMEILRAGVRDVGKRFPVWHEEEADVQRSRVQGLV
ncbi:hypothetical protein SCMU_32720 [Sinomonas cyclohexanicum]|uniref:Uncharacterized protein n=1 Tax=Sinomonas cyclohexanicum TaxID=322009 RepID=A0ABM7PYP2_SINCY|nr:hypothetical protein SCMU_32720 [Corynebacterium cyclohexanicum]